MTSIQSFIDNYIELKANNVISSVEVVNKYIEINKSTTGKYKLYAAIQNLRNVTKVKQSFIGISFKSVISQPVVVSMETPVITQMTPYQMAKLKQQEEFKKQELVLKQKKLEQQEKLKQAELEQQEKLKNLELKQQVKLKVLDLEDKQKDRDFIEKENNKNRQMYNKTKFNQYMDLKVYGTPATQYITQESLISVIGFNVFNGVGTITKPKYKSIVDKVKEQANSIVVVENGISKNIDAINVNDVKSIVDKIEIDNDEKDHINPVLSKIDTIPSIAIRDDERAIDTCYQEKKKIQNPTKHNSMKNKYDYVKPFNNLSLVKNEYTIKCYCCQANISLNSAGCHRAHDIPRSQGGDCSKENVYLTCSTCNQSMTDEYSVHEYKTQLYIDLESKIISEE